MKRKTGILFITDILIVKFGAEKNLYQVVTNLDKSKFSPVVCCLEGNGLVKEFLEENIKVVNIRLKRIYGLRAFKALITLKKVVQKENIGIIATYHESSDFIGLVLGLICGIPVVSNRRNMGYNLKTRHILIYRIINKLFRQMITVSDAVKDRIIKEQKASQKLIQTIYNGIDVEEFVSKSKNEKGNLTTLNMNEPIVGIVAGLRGIKGQKYFLDAAHEVHKAHPKTQFLIVGTHLKGDEDYSWPKLEDYATKLGVSEKVIYLGLRKDVPYIMSLLDVSVLSSLSEGFSNTILESMAAGKPVVATDVGGNPEAIVDGETGFLVPPKDPKALAKEIIRLLENKPLAQKMGSAGRERVRQYFTLEGMIKKYELIYESILRAKVSEGEKNIPRKKWNFKAIFL